MNMYDEAHGLARAMEQSVEMQRLVHAKEALAADPAAAKMAKRYLALQMEMEYGRMLGKTPEEKVLAEYRDLHVMVQNHAAVKEYVDALGRWQVMVADVQKIIGDAMKAGMLDFDASPTDAQ